MNNRKLNAVLLASLAYVATYVAVAMAGGFDPPQGAGGGGGAAVTWPLFNPAGATILTGSPTNDTYVWGSAPVQGNGGGNVNINGGYGSATDVSGGNVTVLGGSIPANANPGMQAGSLFFQAGTCNSADSYAGNIAFQSGVNSVSGLIAGSISFTGSSVSTYAGSGYAFICSSNGVTNSIDIYTYLRGAPGTTLSLLGADDYDASNAQDVLLAGGAAYGTSGNGGGVILSAGYSANGTNGSVRLADANGDAQVLVDGNFNLTLGKPGSSVYVASITSHSSVVGTPISRRGVSFTADTTCDFYPVDATSGNVTATLMQASTVPGVELTFKKVDATANTVTITRASSDTIDGATTYVLTTQYQSVTLKSEGSANVWWVK